MPPVDPHSAGSGRWGRLGPLSRVGTGACVFRVGIFAGIGLVSIAFGGNYLDYGGLPLDLEPAEVRAMGILGIEIGVALGVTACWSLFSTR